MVASTDPPSLPVRAASAARAVAGREPGLVAIGAVGLLLAGVCALGVTIGGAEVAPEGDLLDAAAFDLGVGVFTLTVAVLLPLAGLSPEARQRWRRLSYVFLGYGLVLETVQAFRGIDPRFTEEGSQLDEIAGIVFGLTAALNTVLFVVLGVRFFRRDVLADRPTIRLGVRYGVAAVWISFAVGVVMSVAGGRQLGDDGSLMLAHGFGVHGLQALPVLAMLVAAGADGHRAARVHVAGVAWLAACSLALLQALLGRPALEWSPLTVLIGLALTVWAVDAAASLVSWGHTTSWRAA